MNIIKKIISVNLVLVLLAGNSSMLSAKDFLDRDIFYNSTDGATAVDPSSGAKYISSGSGYLRFKRTGGGVPWFAVGAPGMRANCSGFDYNLGFITMIDFDELGEQLKQAGSSFVWGLLMGLAYSMPALKQVLDDINDWIQGIQGMLKDSCAAGMKITSSLPGSPLKVLDGAIEKNIGKSLAYKQEHQLPNVFEYLLENAPKLPKKEISALGARIVNDIIVVSQDSVNIFLSGTITRGMEQGVIFADISPGANFSIKEVALENAGFSDSTLLATYILLANVSHKEVTPSATAFIKKYTSQVPKEEQMKDNLEWIKNGTNEDGKIKVPFISSSKELSEGTDLFKFIINGKPSADSKKIIPFSNKAEYKLLLVKYKVKSSSGTSERKIVLFTNGDSTKKIKFFEDWDGILTQSKSLYAGVSAATYANSRGVEYSGPNLTTLKMAAIDPDTIKSVRHMTILTKNSSTGQVSENLKNGGTEVLRTYIGVIATKNAIEYVKQIITAVKYNIGDYSISLQEGITIDEKSEAKPSSLVGHMEMKNEAEELAKLFKSLEAYKREVLDSKLVSLSEKAERIEKDGLSKKVTLETLQDANK